jgi:hypothetical protein
VAGCGWSFFTILLYLYFHYSYWYKKWDVIQNNTAAYYHYNVELWPIVQEPGKCMRYRDLALSWTVWGSNPSSAKRSYSSPKHPDQPWGPPSHLFSGYWGTCLRIKWPRCDVVCSPPCSAKVNDEWNYTSMYSICLHGMDWDNFTICSFILLYMQQLLETLQWKHFYLNMSI